MKLFKSIKYFFIIVIFHLCIINLVSSRRFEYRYNRYKPRYNLPPYSRISYNYTGYMHHLQTTNRRDLIIELIPVPKWRIKPKTIEVNDDPLINLFGKAAAGKVLKLDERTQLYRLPPADHSVTEEDRLNMLWFHKSYVNYCAEPIGKVGLIDGVRAGAHVVCTDDFDNDKCCGEVNKCRCIIATFGCVCITKEAHERRMSTISQYYDIGKITVGSVTEFFGAIMNKLKK